MITIWNTARLKEKLIDKSLSEGQAFIYFFAILLFDYSQFTFDYLGLNGQEPNIWVKTNIIGALALTFFGVLYVFWCNGGTKGEQFFHRYFSLSVVVGIKFVILILGLPILVDIATNGEADNMFPWLGSVMIISLNILMFIFIGKHMKSVAHAT
jgi:hypothetical protein